MIRNRFPQTHYPEVRCTSGPMLQSTKVREFRPGRENKTRIVGSILYYTIRYDPRQAAMYGNANPSPLARSPPLSDVVYETLRKPDLFARLHYTAHRVRPQAKKSLEGRPVRLGHLPMSPPHEYRHTAGGRFAGGVMGCVLLNEFAIMSLSQLAKGGIEPTETRALCSSST